MNSIIPVQIKLIKMGQKHLCISDEDYREMLRARYPSCRKGSCKELSFDDASDLIDFFKKQGFEIKQTRPARKPKKAPGIVELPSPGQTKMIKALAHDIKWRAGMVKGLAGYTKRMLGHDRPRDIKEASRLIENLKHMKANQQKEASGG